MLKRIRSSFATMFLALGVSLSLLALSGAQSPLVAQDIRASLFAQADEAMQGCQAAGSDVLVPKSYAEAMKHYRKAEEDLQQGRNLDGIRKELADATKYFQQAMEGTELAKVTLATAISAREDAVSADAMTFAAEAWRNAEKKFTEAAERLERGDVKSAQSRGGEAESLFRQAELEAIKSNLLKDTWSLLETADRTDVDKRAPKTLELAQELVNAADRELNDNRYDSDEPRALAQEANYEARHALYLASVTESVEKKRLAVEDLLLASEEPLARVAGALDIRAEFDEGPETTTAQILEEVAALQQEVERLNSQVAAGGEQIASLEARILELQSDLGGVEREKSELAERVEAQARLREKFAGVETMFDRDEARVLREGNDVIIRLTSLTFASGKSDLDPQYFGLLTTVQRVIEEFPGSRVSIEGHTDSFGGDEQNLALSQRRADAVRQYLLANMRLDPSLIDAIGYGETRPVGLNETPEGRARNRRIEVVIHPELALVSQ